MVLGYPPCCALDLDHLVPEQINQGWLRKPSVFGPAFVLLFGGHQSGKH